MARIVELARDSDFIIYGGIVFGLLVAHRIINIIRLCLTYILPARADFVKFADGGFALITGGAGGIGKQTAFEFAKLGIDLYLMDYNGTMLDKTVNEIKKSYPKIKVKCKTMDLSTIKDEKVYLELCNELSKLKIGILFNCAGIAEYKVFRFNDNTHKEIVALNDINATVPVLLYRAVLPQMVERRNGLMLVMSSASAMSPQAVLPVYGSTKSYVLQLSRSLQNQFPYEYSGIYFHAFQPQFVRTPMTDGRLNIASKFIYPDVEQWVPQALKSVMANNDGHSAGCLSHEFLVWCQANLSNIIGRILGLKRKTYSTAAGKAEQTTTTQ